MLSPSAVKRFYDRFGAKQDSQAVYEDRALDDLVASADFAQARAIVELGCGTGRFAKRILASFPEVSYRGFDVSTTMLRLARDSVSPFGGRASVLQLEPGTVRLPVPDRSADRLVSTYVLDLLPRGDIAAFFEEALRVLEPGGRVCLVSLTAGRGAFPRLVTGLWSLVHRLGPQLVGGCRPIRLTEYCDPARWEILHHRTVVMWGVPSEILVTRPRAASS
jgi:ubiquinone/menaquinone biosynthesis C-methylase UbiE